MLVKELRQASAPRGTTYCQTEWMRVIHLTRNGRRTLCNNPVALLMTDSGAMYSDLNVCHGCFAGK